MRIKGWMGRADQTTKVKGMFVRPEQVAEVGKRHPELGARAPRRHPRGRAGRDDAASPNARRRATALARGRSPTTLQAVTKLRGRGRSWWRRARCRTTSKAIADERRSVWTLQRNPSCVA